MKFYDIAKVSFSSGKWWDWCSAWRREKSMPFGWPAWWDGGKWWSVILKASTDVNTLIDFNYKKNFKAQPWWNWMSHDKYGKDAENVILKVPVWTVLKDTETGNVIYQFTRDQEEYIVVKWGKWWLWNIHFKNSLRQFPEFSIMWEPGEKKDITMELQLLWDVALIWTPSVGKSTIINTISNAKAKVWDYPFTTLVPNLGIVKYWDYNFSVVDVPWLIQWASKWKWLWNEFLRHVLKARIWCFVLDISRYENWLDEFIEIFSELVSYVKTRFIGSTEYWPKVENIEISLSKNSSNEIIFEVFTKFGKEKVLLLRKMVSFVLNKYDVLDDKDLLKEFVDIFIAKILKWLEKIFKKKLKTVKFSLWKLTLKSLNTNIDILSCFSRFWVQQFIEKLVTKMQSFDSIDILWFEKMLVAKEQDSYVKDITEKEKRTLISNWYVQTSDMKYIKVWEVYDRDFARMVYTLPWWNDEAELWFWENLDKTWYVKIFEKYWVVKWDIFKVKSIYAGIEDRYVMWD